MERINWGLLLGVAVAVLFSVRVDAGIFDFDSDCGNNKTHNFTYGTKAYYDKIFYTIHASKEFSFLRKVSLDVTYPPPGQPSKGMITFIEVLDQYHDGNGGCSFISNGGPGARNVTLHLKSKRNYGLDFLINIYGH